MPSIVIKPEQATETIELTEPFYFVWYNDYSTVYGRFDDSGVMRVTETSYDNLPSYEIEWHRGKKVLTLSSLTCKTTKATFDAACERLNNFLHETGVLS